MNRLLKILGVVVGVIVLLLVVAGVAVTMLVDPNDYKDEITAAVQDATGRELTLAGDLARDVFPTIRIAMGEGTLSNAPGFGAEPMARIESASLSVGLLPLLSQRVEIGSARLTGLTLNLARDARGRNNWQDLSGGTAAAEPAAAEAPAEGGVDIAGSLGVDEVEIENARIVWNDASTGSRWELTDFGLTAEGFDFGEQFPLSMEFALAGADVAVRVAASTQATLDLADNEYQLEDLQITVDGSG